MALRHVSFDSALLKDPAPVAPGRFAELGVSLFDRVPAGLDAIGDVLGGLAADEVDHAGPE